VPAHEAGQVGGEIVGRPGRIALGGAGVRAAGGPLADPRADLGPVVRAELVADLDDVALDGAHGEAETLRDRQVREALGDQRSDLVLTARQLTRAAGRPWHSPSPIRRPTVAGRSRWASP